MEFGDFANLPIADKRIVDKILFSHDNDSKDKNRPEVV